MVKLEVKRRVILNRIKIFEAFYKRFKGHLELHNLSQKQ